MVSTHTSTSTVARPRVREQARDALAVMVFSAVASAGVAFALVLLARLGS